VWKRKEKCMQDVAVKTREGTTWKTWTSMNLKIGGHGLNLAEDGDKWRAVVSTVMNLRVL